MGMQIEISKWVTVELRRDSVILYVSQSSDEGAPADSFEFAYDYLDDVIKGLQQVREHDRYRRYMSGPHGN